MENKEISQQEKTGIFETAKLKTIIPKTPKSLFEKLELCHSESLDYARDKLCRGIPLLNIKKRFLHFTHFFRFGRNDKKYTFQTDSKEKERVEKIKEQIVDIEKYRGLIH